MVRIVGDTHVPFVKSKTQIILPAKMGLFGNNRTVMQDMQATAKPQASPTNKGEEHYFMEKEEEVGRGCFG